MEQPDPALLEQFRNGSQEAFRQLYKLYFGTVYFQLLRLLGQEALAEKLTANVFVKCWNLRSNFTELTNLKSFLLVTAYREILDHAQELPEQPARTVAGSDEELFSEEVLHEVLLRLLQDEVH
ncbi:MAG: sigma factor [Candidatus Pseudobacter hemicellulosilyticus]|uniref:Sigma factor n=1 Tax=Candidatus Pseudobacter hemicellulosilyticus TaxID=3121375 RepID=A0AAJ5WRJ8_9BACT|nr:MAG: sigma factor [Pseudobacter sp.]